jgi:hypothetical protein
MDGTKELRGSRAICLDLTGDDPEKAIWRKAVLSNLSASEADISNMASVLVAKHHWLYAQLEYFEKKTGLESQFHFLPCTKLLTLLTHKTEYRKRKMALFPHSKPSS